MARPPGSRCSLKAQGAPRLAPRASPLGDAAIRGRCGPSVCARGLSFEKPPKTKPRSGAGKVLNMEPDWPPLASPGSSEKDSRMELKRVQQGTQSAYKLRPPLRLRCFMRFVKKQGCTKTPESSVLLRKTWVGVRIALIALGAQKLPKWLPKLSQNEPQTLPKRPQHKAIYTQ